MKIFKHSCDNIESGSNLREITATSEKDQDEGIGLTTRTSGLCMNAVDMYKPIF